MYTIPVAIASMNKKTSLFVVLGNSRGDLKTHTKIEM